MNRRKLIASTGALAAGAILAGCAAGSSVSTVTASAIADITAVQTSLSALAPVLATIPSITSTDVSYAQNYLTLASNALAAISATSTAVAGTSAFTQAEGYIEDALTIVSVFTLPTGISTVVSALKIALPIVLASIQGAVSGSTPAAISVLQNSKSIVTLK